MADVIPFDQRDGSLWYDGRMVPWKDAKTHVLTHGLHYGSCVFEGQRIYGGTIYKLKEHTARLFKSAETLGMKIPFTEDQINQACIDVAEVQGIKDGYLRPVAFRGSEMMAVSAQNTKIHVAIACWPWPSYFSPAEKLKGIRLDIAEWKRPAPDTAPTRVAVRSSLRLRLARRPPTPSATAIADHVFSAPRRAARRSRPDASVSRPPTIHGVCAPPPAAAMRAAAPRCSTTSGSRNNNQRPRACCAPRFAAAAALTFSSARTTFTSRRSSCSATWLASCAALEQPEQE